MDEARRFLRYVLPGTLFGLLTSSLLWLLLPDWTRSVAASVFSTADWTAAIAGLLASGGIGYVLSVIHHTIHWMGDSGVLDHRRALTRLVDRDVLRLYEIGLTEEHTAISRPIGLSRREAWVITSALWHQRLETSPQIKGADLKTVGFADQIHAVGTARVAVLASLVAVLAIASQVSVLSAEREPMLRFIATCVVGFGALGLFQRSYEQIGDLAQRVIDQILSDALSAEVATHGGRPVSTRIDLSLPRPSIFARTWKWLGPKLRWCWAERPSTPRDHASPVTSP